MKGKSRLTVLAAVMTFAVVMLLSAAVIPAGKAHAEGTIKVTFDANGGSETMTPAEVEQGETFTVPDCDFTAPEGKVFWRWRTVREWTAETPGVWYDPGDKIDLTQDITLYAIWSEPALSVCSYDNANQESSKGGVFKVTGENMWFDSRWSHGCSNYTVHLGDQFTVTAAADNGYRFIGWYKGQYIHTDAQGNPTQSAIPYMDQLITEEKTYSFTVDDNFVLCPVFEAAPLIGFVDIGNVWDRLDPVNLTPFTGEVNPNEDGLADYIELQSETWTSTDGESVISSSEPGIPILGKTYMYSAAVTAKGENVFDPAGGFRFIYGGTEYAYTDLAVTYSDDHKTAVISGFIPNKTVEPVDLSDAAVTGVKNKTYTGKAQTQSPVVNMNVNGTDFTLIKDTDYSLSYKNNVKAGTATLTVEGTGRYTGNASVTFKINKAANPLKVKGRTASVKYSALKKKAQTLKVSKVIAFTKKGQGTMSYRKASGNAKITINKKTGKVTVKKGLKKGTYKVKIKVKAAGNANYKASSLKTVTCKIKVK